MVLIEVIPNCVTENIKSVKGVKTFKDNLGIITVETILVLSDEESGFKTLIYLPGNNPVVKTLAQQQHVLSQHAEVLTLMNSLRENYWITSIRRLTKTIISTCIVCKTYKAKYADVRVAPLLQNRIRGWWESIIRTVKELLRFKP